MVVPVERVQTVTQSPGEPSATPAPATTTATARTDESTWYTVSAPAGARTLSVMALGFTPSRRVVTMGRHTAELSITLKAAAPFPTTH